MNMKKAEMRDDTKVLSLVQDLTELKMDIRKLTQDAKIAEHKVIDQLVRERRTDCLSINYGALRRFYHN